MMDQRRLGSERLGVSEIGLECMGMSEFYGTGEEDESIATIRRAIDLGVNLLDTADMYGPFTNERLVGKAIEGRRDEVNVATKFGIQREEDDTWVGINGRPDYVRSPCDASLRRLRVDHIDLYYQHRVDPETPIEETVGVLKELVEVGKVRCLGLSEAAPETIKRAQEVHPISVLQTEYSMWSCDVEDEILPTLRALAIGFVAYSLLRSGFLTGQIKSFENLSEGDYRRQSPRFQGENFDKNLELVERENKIVAEKDVTPGQLTLAWLLHRGEDVVPIPGTKRREYLEENVAASDIELTEEDLRRIEEVAPKDAAAGERYADMSSVNR